MPLYSMAAVGTYSMLERAPQPHNLNSGFGLWIPKPGLAVSRKTAQRKSPTESACWCFCRYASVSGLGCATARRTAPRRPATLATLTRSCTAKLHDKAGRDETHREDNWPVFRTWREAVVGVGTRICVPVCFSQ